MRFATGRFLAVLGLCALLAGCGNGSTSNTNVVSPQGGSATSQSTTTPPSPSGISFPDVTNGNQAKNNSLAYGWNLFIAMNWPASSERGVPDLTQPFGSNGTTTWETMRASVELYKADGSLPAAYNDPAPLPTQVLPNLASQLDPTVAFMGLMRLDGIVSGYFLQDVNGNNLQYEIQINQTLYNSVVAQGLYNWNGQAALIAEGVPSVEFPSSVSTDKNTSIELKASWSVLEPGEETALRSTYHVAQGLVNLGTIAAPQYELRYMALTGLHILSKPPGMPTWFWTTFEHVDNPERTPIAFQQFKQNPIPSNVAAFNQQMQAQLAGTVWANYQMNGVQPGTFVNSNGSPSILANSQIETDFATTSSCITCHSQAYDGVPFQFAKTNGIQTIGNGPPYAQGTPNFITPIFATDNLPTATGFVGLPPLLPPQPNQLATDFLFSPGEAQPTPTP